MLTFLDSLPETQADLMVALGHNGAQLESVLVRAPLVFCTIRVMNVAFEKSVSVRVTGDDWKTFTDVDASYFPGSSDGRSDRFYVSTAVYNFSIGACMHAYLLSDLPRPHCLCPTTAPRPACSLRCA